MSFWFLLPMAASAGLQYAGAKASAEATKAGAKAGAEIEKMNRDYMQRTFERAKEYQMPFYEAAMSTREDYESAMSGERDATKYGTSKTKSEHMARETQSMSQYVKDLTQRTVSAVENEAQKNRLLDIMQIGLGGASAAGQVKTNLGSALAGSNISETGYQTNALLSGAAIKQSAYTNLLDTLSGLPAVMTLYGDSGGQRQGQLNNTVLQDTANPKYYQGGGQWA